MTSLISILPAQSYHRLSLVLKLPVTTKLAGELISYYRTRFYTRSKQPPLSRNTQLLDDFAIDKQGTLTFSKTRKKVLTYTEEPVPFMRSMWGPISSLILFQAFAGEMWQYNKVSEQLTPCPWWPEGEQTRFLSPDSVAVTTISGKAISARGNALNVPPLRIYYDDDRVYVFITLDNRIIVRDEHTLEMLVDHEAPEAFVFVTHWLDQYSYLVLLSDQGHIYLLRLEAPYELTRIVTAQRIIALTHGHPRYDDTALYALNWDLSVKKLIW